MFVRSTALLNTEPITYCRSEAYIGRLIAAVGGQDSDLAASALTMLMRSELTRKMKRSPAISTTALLDSLYLDPTATGAPST